MTASLQIQGAVSPRKPHHRRPLMRTTNTGAVPKEEVPNPVYLVIPQRSRRLSRPGYVSPGRHQRAYGRTNDVSRTFGKGLQLRRLSVCPLCLKTRGGVECEGNRGGTGGEQGGTRKTRRTRRTRGVPAARWYKCSPRQGHHDIENKAVRPRMGLSPGSRSDESSHGPRSSTTSAPTPREYEHASCGRRIPPAPPSGPTPLHRLPRVRMHADVRRVGAWQVRERTMAVGSVGSDGERSRDRFWGF